MTNFEAYANYYDLLYQDKKYDKEAKYINELISQNLEENKNLSMLDMGCGTGIHAKELSNFGYVIKGIDLSENMIKKAIDDNENLCFEQADIRNYRDNTQKYNIITSLFHVISYQTDNESLINAFQTAFYNLNKGGIFIFDFWYGPGVLTDLPEKRTKIIENSNIKVIRNAQPTMEINKNVVNVNYQIDIIDKVNDTSTKIEENHPMRYFFLPELHYFLKSCGFTILQDLEWLSFKKPTMESWNSLIIAKK